MLYLSNESGQGLVEYALILVLVAVIDSDHAVLGAITVATGSDCRNPTSSTGW